MAIFSNHREEVAKSKENIERAQKSGNPAVMKVAMMSQWDLYRTWGYKPFLGLLSLIQIPFFFGMFRACSISSKLPVPGWQTGGALWFTDLTAVDPFFILPVISGATTAATIFVCLPAKCFSNF